MARSTGSGSNPSPRLGRPEVWARQATARASDLLATHWPALVILAVAVGVRFAGLFPTFFYGDDAEYATVARSLLEDPRNLAYPDIEGWGPHPFVSQPPLLIYLFAGAGALLGDIETGAVVVSAVLGAATALVVYAIGVRLQGPGAGILAGGIVAVLPAHVSMSRKAFLDTGFAFFFALSILFFLLWLDRRTRGWAVATGLAVGATCLSKLPGILVLAPLLAGVAWALLRAWRKDPAGRRSPWPSDWISPPPKAPHDEPGRGWTRTWHHVLLAAIPVVLMGLAYLALLWHLQATVDLWDKLVWQVARVEGAAPTDATGPWHVYLTHADHGIPAMMGGLTVAFLLAGAAWLLHRLWTRPARRPGDLAVLLWPLVVIAFFSLSSRKIHFYILPALPGLAIWAGLPVGWAVSRIIQRGRQDPELGLQKGATALLAVAIVVAAIPPTALGAKSVDRFVMEEKSYGYGLEEAAQVIHERDPDAGQIGSLLGRFTLHFYNQQPTYHWYVDHGFVEQEIRRGEIRYVVADTWLDLPREQAWMEDLVDRYNGTLVTTYDSPASGTTKVWVYELHPGGGNLTGAPDG